MKRTKKIIGNKYVLTLLIFGVWMTFFDSNGFSHQWNISRKLKNLQQAHQEKRKEVEMIKRKSAMLKEGKSLERYAREEFRFKKPNEEIFVIVAPE